MAKMQRAIYRKSLMDDPRHLMRWLKAQAVGGSPEEAAKAVAKSEGISLKTAQQSIVEVEAYRKKNDRTEFDYAIRDFVISTMPQAKETLNNLLAATELVEVKNNKTGKTEIVKMDDKVTQLEAQRIFKDVLIGLQPKGPLVENNFNPVNQIANMSSAETYEERLSRLRKKAQEHNLLPPEVTAVPKEIDAGSSEEDDDGEDDEEVS